MNKAFNLFRVIGKLEAGENLILDKVRETKAIVTVNGDKDKALLLDYIETEEKAINVVIDYTKRYIIVL